MISGEFGRTGRPYVWGRLELDRLGISGRLPFLVDTGSDQTIIHPPALRYLGLATDRLANLAGTHGVGGRVTLFFEPAILYFRDDDRSTAYTHRLAIGIAEPTDANRNYPSLLGRDILDCWYLESDPTNGLLQFTVRRTA